MNRTDLLERPSSPAVGVRPVVRLPAHCRSDAPRTPAVGAMRKVLRAHRLNSVCEEARCPNLNRCFAEGTATFMLLGDVCTRTCRFCNVATGRPRPVDPDEPDRVA